MKSAVQSNITHLFDFPRQLELLEVLKKYHIEGV